MKVQAVARPTLFSDLLWVWVAFDYLSNKRIQSESGPQAIQISEILAYVTLTQIDGIDERDDVLRFISVLDGTFLAHTYKKRAEAEKKAQGKKRK